MRNQNCSGTITTSGLLFSFTNWAHSQNMVLFKLSFRHAEHNRGDKLHGACQGETYRLSFRWLRCFWYESLVHPANKVAFMHHLLLHLRLLSKCQGGLDMLKPAIHTVPSLLPSLSPTREPSWLQGWLSYSRVILLIPSRWNGESMWNMWNWMLLTPLTHQKWLCMKVALYDMLESAWIVEAQHKPLKLDPVEPIMSATFDLASKRSSQSAPSPCFGKTMDLVQVAWLNRLTTWTQSKLQRRERLWFKGGWTAAFQHKCWATTSVSRFCCRLLLLPVSTLESAVAGSAAIAPLAPTWSGMQWPTVSKFTNPHDSSMSFDPQMILVMD